MVSVVFGVQMLSFIHSNMQSLGEQRKSPACLSASPLPEPPQPSGRSPGLGRGSVVSRAAPALAQVEMPDQGNAAQQGQGGAHPNGRVHQGAGPRGH